ncbi:MAG: YqgE/AlgH family protein [Gammaproteobacteria bacterium]|nr:YqgE/AlgH family protein [Gammaproteobacteria bacterium]
MRCQVLSFLLCISIVLTPGAGQAEAAANTIVKRVETPAAGKFLVARRDMPDPRFRETVVLLLRHDIHGSAGLIINRQTSIPLPHHDPDIKGTNYKDQQLFFGGPVATSAILYLIRSDERPDDAEPVIKGVHIGTTQQNLEALLEAGKTMAELRLYLGHAGWAPGQLVSELRRGDWHLFDADADAIFTNPEQRLWERYIKQREPLDLMAAQ